MLNPVVKIILFSNMSVVRHAKRMKEAKTRLGIIHEFNDLDLFNFRREYKALSCFLNYLVFSLEMFE